MFIGSCFQSKKGKVALHVVANAHVGLNSRYPYYKRFIYISSHNAFNSVNFDGIFNKMNFLALRDEAIIRKKLI